MINSRVMTFSFPSHIKSDYTGYGVLVKLHSDTKKLENTYLALDLANTVWLEANLCAGLGAILKDVEDRGNKIYLRNVRPNVTVILSKNGFLEAFGGDKMPDTHSTTIQFSTFDVSNARLFVDYLDKQLLAQPDLPKMSDLLKKKINKSIFELFNNAYTHGRCKIAFSCGQYYPNKFRLDFTIVDLGRTIRKNVRDYLGKPDMSGPEAIKWAVMEGNTTKVGNIPGGLGLSLIRDFLKLNEGKIQIVSSDGYWEEIKGKESFSLFKQTFTGTIVNLEFNINDSHSYVLSSEVDPSSIF